VTEQLKKAIRDDGRTLNALAQAAGIDHASLWRFMAGQRDLHLATADALCRALRLGLAPMPEEPAPAPKGRKGK
jgi:hypothetical protein